MNHLYRTKEPILVDINGDPPLKFLGYSNKSRDGAVGIATGYGLDYREVEFESR
jgi:hypothetical protein